MVLQGYHYMFSYPFPENAVGSPVYRLTDVVGDENGVRQSRAGGTAEFEYAIFSALSLKRLDSRIRVYLGCLGCASEVDSRKP